jgi:hypothetical protein
VNKLYSSKKYLASWALDAKENKTAITKRGVGMWWKASFKDGTSIVESVKVKNRVDCCGERLT